MEVSNKDKINMVRGLINQRKHNEEDGKWKGRGCPFALAVLGLTCQCFYLFPRLKKRCPCSHYNMDYVVRRCRQFVKEATNGG